jgi:ABC-type glycerol-3-phosphate transport system substrate-binding protein
MKTRRMARHRIAAGVGALALLAMGGLSACGGQKTETPSTTPTTTTTTTSPAVTPTEKGLEPNGGNKFTPTVKAPTPATAVPGDN